MITYSLLTEVGSRSNNEDNIGMFQKGETYYFVLADGLGGHGKGELASKIAVEKSIEVLSLEDEKEEDCLNKAFDISQQEILEGQQSDRTAGDMKTTMVLLKVGHEKIQWGYIGDSRLYYFKDGKMILRTMDHSVPQMLAAAGKIKEKQIRNHPDRNRLLRVMGIPWEQSRYQIEPSIDREPRQAFLLCSDGFWELIDERHMISCLKKASDAEDWLKRMEAIVLKNGRKKDMDNYSAIGIWTGQEG